MARDAELWAVGERDAILALCAIGARLAEAEDPATAERALQGLAEAEAGGVVLVERGLAGPCASALDVLRESGRWLVLAVPLGPAPRPQAGEAAPDDLRALVIRALGFDVLGAEGG